MSNQEGFSFSRMHKLLQEKKKQEDLRVVPFTSESEPIVFPGAKAQKPLFPRSKFPTGEKRTTLRISMETADKARELENKVYWLTKKRLSLAEQARLALNIFLELPLEIDDITEDDDLELFIAQKALKLVEKIKAQL